MKTDLSDLILVLGGRADSSKLFKDFFTAEFRHLDPCKLEKLAIFYNVKKILSKNLLLLLFF